MAREPKACGIEMDRPSPASIMPNRTARTGVRSGSSQFVTHEVSIQTHQTASMSMKACSTPSPLNCSASVCDSCVTA